MIRTSLAIVALTAATAAQAEITADYHRYTVGDREYEGYVATNTAITPKGTVLIVHDWDGMTAYEERRAQMLAALGYTAFAIDVYGADEDPQSVEENRALSGALYGDREEFRARLMGSIAEAANITGATDNVAMMGYCFGGAAVLEAARAGAELNGFVSFHGGLGTPEGQDYSAASAPVMLFHGSADPVSGMADLAALLDELQAAGVEHGAEVFGGARHSFTVHGSDDYDLTADQESWEGLLEFLDVQL
ncbi:dienelactone hydrolase family protein [Thalassococcus profundi]|uniref:Dienelactone hydrolase family protein n=1 Tax=Thalassococcus profundi TaxID=2282382 RepID=A0A369TMB7_9RHOB|nr:dienelactone hydrolase family protein [Thalassococcus profundi]RDD65814.1 dienelactone hydrolase family protein [Thalassococcus profundi]